MEQTSKDLYETVCKMLDIQDFTSSNIFNITFVMMQQIESVKMLTGQQKKLVVLNVLQRYTNEHFSGQHAQDLTFVINVILPGVIDTVVSIDKNELSIHTLKKSCCMSLKRLSYSKN